MLGYNPTVTINNKDFSVIKCYPSKVGRIVLIDEGDQYGEYIVVGHSGEHLACISTCGTLLSCLIKKFTMNQIIDEKGDATTLGYTIDRILEIAPQAGQRAKNLLNRNAQIIAQLVDNKLQERFNLIREILQGHGHGEDEETPEEINTDEYSGDVEELVVHIEEGGEFTLNGDASTVRIQGENCNINVNRVGGANITLKDRSHLIIGEAENLWVQEAE